MDLKTFKKILNDTLMQEGLFRKRSYYYYDSAEVICVIGLQKSNFSQAFYINVGYLVKSLHGNLDKIRDVDGDIRTRFSHLQSENSRDDFSFEELGEEEFKKEILGNIKNLIKPASSKDGLKSILNNYPVLLYQTRPAAKKLFGYSLE
jgi:hypothetical protein